MTDQSGLVDPEAELDMPLLRRDEPDIAGVIDDLTDERNRFRDALLTSLNSATPDESQRGMED